MLICKNVYFRTPQGKMPGAEQDSPARIESPGGGRIARMRAARLARGDLVLLGLGGFGLDRADVHDHVPALVRRHCVAVRWHPDSAVADIAVDVAVGKILADPGAQVGRLVL